MLVYILKSVACLSILFVFYTIFLEKENMHVFKRFYLLGSLILALLIPALVFTEYVEAAPTPVSTEAAPVTIQQNANADDIINVPPALKADILDIEPLVWGIYFLGLFFFGLKFVRNLVQIFSRIRSNPKQRLSRFTQVLLNEKIIPHTFFSYIFLNKKKFEADQIPTEVLLHEETHARQKHSWDVILVELLQVFLWVNPFIYFTKKAIKLNHEFLADQAVLKTNIDKTTYQNTLLSYVSPDSEKKYQPLANAINYSSTRLTVFGKTFSLSPSAVGQVKKRFTVMKKRTSKKAVLFRSFLLLPLLALLLYSFAETKIIQKRETIVDSIVNTDDFEENLNTEGISDRRVEIAGLVLDSETLFPLEKVKIYDSSGNILSKTDSRGYYKVQLNKLGRGEIRFKFSLGKDGYNSLVQREHWGNLQGKVESAFYFALQKKNSASPELSKLVTNPPNLNYESISINFQSIKPDFELTRKLDNAKINNENIFFEIDNVYYLVNDSGWIKINSKEDLISIDDNLIVPASEVNGLLERKEITGMTPLEKNKTALFAIYTIPVNSAAVPIRKASNAEIEEYNKLAKSHNLFSDYNLRSRESEIRRLIHIYSLMTGVQKNSAEIFPDYPPKQDGASRKQMTEYNKLAKHYNEMPNSKMKIYKKDVERLEYIYGLMSKKQKADAELFPDFPEPPPAPVAPEAPNEREEASNIIQKIIKEQDPYDNVHAVHFSLIDKKDAPKILDAPPKEPNARKAPRVLKGEKSNILPPPAPNYKKMEKEIEEQEILMEIEETKLQEQEVVIEEYETKMQEQEILLLEKEVEMEAQEALMEQQEAKMRKKEIELNESTIPAPPKPPKPISPLDHVIEMAKKGAKFYLEEKEITSDKAIEVMKKNKNINIDSRAYNGKRPIVKLSTEPIRIEN